LDHSDKDKGPALGTGKARIDEEAFAELFRLYYDDVFRYCAHRLFDRHIAEDVTSTVFLKVAGNLHRFKGDNDDFRRWLYRIANNAVNEYLRHLRRRARAIKVVAENARGQTLDNIAEGEDSYRKYALLKQAMLNLKPKYQAVITMRFFENMKLTEIAGILGKSPGTVRSQLARGLSKLRKKLAAGGYS